ncbi:MAG: response regulator transcription factor [Candidatus Binatia bacterium]
MKVLVVEDDSSLATIIQIALEENGYQVRTARDGNEGYLTFLLFRPDVVVTDICMPFKDGFELMAQIHAHHPQVKTIYLTAQADQYRTRLEKENRDYSVRVLEKPFSRAELARHIAALTKELPAQPPRARKRVSFFHRS